MSARYKWLPDTAKCAEPMLHFSFEPAALWCQAEAFSFIVQGPHYLSL